MQRFCLSILSLSALVLSSPLLAQRVPDVRLDTDPPGAVDSSDLGIASSGDSVYVAWGDYVFGSPYIGVNVSADRGATWQTSMTQLAVGRSRCPAIAASGDSVYVAFLGNPGTPGPDYYCDYSSDRGVTWQRSGFRLNSNPFVSSTSTPPQVAASGSSVYVMWGDHRTGPGIHLTRSADGGATWLRNDLQLNSAGPTCCADIEASGSSVYVAWSDGRNGGSDIYLNYSADWGATWLINERRLNTNPAGSGASSGAQIATSGSSVYVTWSDSRNGAEDIYFNYSADGGATWLSQDVRLDTDPAGASQSFLPRIAASGSSIHVAWLESRNRRYEVFYNHSLDGGVTWLAQDVRVDTAPPGARGTGSPAIAASGSLVAAAWTENWVGPPGIHLNRSVDSGATWLTKDMRLNFKPPGAGAGSATGYYGMSSPQMAVSGSSVYVAWTDDRSSVNARSDVFFNIPFGALPYGSSTAGTGGVAPELAAAGAPTLGSSISLDVSQGLGGATSALWLGSGRESQTSLSLFGGTLLVRPAVTVPVVLGGAAGVPGAGSLSLPLSIPNLPTLVGANVNFQAILLDPGAPFGLSMTNGLEMWIG